MSATISIAISYPLNSREWGKIERDSVCQKSGSIFESCLLCSSFVPCCQTVTRMTICVIGFRGKALRLTGEAKVMYTHSCRG